MALKETAARTEKSTVLTAVSKKLPVHDCCKNFSYFFDFQNIKPTSKRKITHQKRLDSYKSSQNRLKGDPEKRKREVYIGKKFAK